MDWLDYREKLGIGFCDQEKFQYFKRKIFNFLNAVSKDLYAGCIDIEEYGAFCNTTGIPVNMDYTQSFHDKERFEQCLSVIERTTSLNEFLAYYVALLNAVKTEKPSEHNWTRKRFLYLLSKMLTESHIPFDVLKDDEKCFIFPKGAEEMDASLVSQPLHWLESYPVAHKAFVKALKAYAEADEENASDVADKFRKALESFFQEFFGGCKSLENYKAEYGSYLKRHEIPKEISGNLETLLQSYTNYMNNYAKHRDATSDSVLEYIMYQTGNIIRLLIALKSKEQV